MVDGQMSDAAREMKSGRLAQAEAIYSDVLRRSPGHAEALFRLALIGQRKRDFNSALRHIEQAILAGGQKTEYGLLKGNLLQDARRLADAEASFREVINIEPGSARAWNNLGIVLRDLGRDAEALLAFERAVELDKCNFRALNNLGIALHSAGSAGEAIRYFRRALNLKPDYSMAKHNLASALLSEGDRAAAEPLFHEVMCEHPEFAPASIACGTLLLDRFKFTDAEACARLALKQDPRNAEGINLLGQALALQGRTAEAQEVYRGGVALAPENLKAALGANLSLPPACPDRAALEQARARFADGLRVLAENTDLYAANPPERVLKDLQWNNFYLAYQGLDDKPLQCAYSEFVERLLERAAPQFMRQKSGSDCEGRRVRVGFLGSFFFQCTAGTYFSSWITGMDREKFEIFVYYNHFERDSVTARIQSAADHFVQLQGSVAKIAQQVDSDDLDVLIFPESGMNGQTFLLSAMRLAPVQCAGWGHPVTTGHRNVDYFLTSDLMEPDNAQEHYTEKLVRLPGIGTCYAMPVLPEPVPRAVLGLPEGKNLYLCPQSLFKIHPDNDALFLKALEKDSNGVLIFFSGRQEAVAGMFRERLAQVLAQAGMNPVDRVLLLPNLGHDDYLRVNMACDVMLDTLYWSGGNTALDALACGLPMVAIEGEFMRGRQSSGMLRAMGMEELIARDGDDYADIAFRLAQEPGYRSRVSEKIWVSVGAVFGDMRPIKALEQFLAEAVG